MTESEKKKVVPFSVRFDPDLFDDLESTLNRIPRDKRPSKDKFIQDAVQALITGQRTIKDFKHSKAYKALIEEFTLDLEMSEPKETYEWRGEVEKICNSVLEELAPVVAKSSPSPKPGPSETDPELNRKIEAVLTSGSEKAISVIRNMIEATYAIVTSGMTDQLTRDFMGPNYNPPADKADVVSTEAETPKSETSRTKRDKIG